MKRINYHIDDNYKCEGENCRHVVKWPARLCEDCIPFYHVCENCDELTDVHAGKLLDCGFWCNECIECK